MNFLKQYSKLNEGTEIPGLFAVWCGLASLSCVMGRRVWIDMGTYTIFPNMYIILVAGSGKCRKSTSISVAEKLLLNVEPSPNILPQKTSPSALIRDIKIVNTTDENQFLSESSEGFVIADELVTFLNKKTYDDLGSILIQFYDCKKKFVYSTRERGLEILNDVCLGLLGGTTIDWLKLALPIDAIGGGLTSRMNFVYVPKAPPPVPRTRYTQEQRKISSELILYLQELLSVRGEMALDKEAWKVYEDEYIDFYNNSNLFGDNSTAGYASRRGLHLMKLAMLFSMSESPDLVVKKVHIEQAKNLLELSERFLPMLMSIITANETGLLLDTIYNVIKQEKTADRKSILGKVSNRVDSKRLTDLLETLIQSGRIKCFANGRDVYYEVLT